MKIVFISPAFYPSIGGVETHVLEVSRELVRRGHSVKVITEQKSSDWQSYLSSDNEAGKLKSIEESTYFVHKKLDQIDIYYFKFGQPSFLKKFKIWILMLHNLNLFRHADIIHAHDVFIWYLPLRFILFQKKIFTTFHGYEGKFPPEDKAILIRSISNKLSYGSINVGAFIEKWYRTKSDYVTYGGVKEIKNLENKIYEKRKKIKILLVGRLEKDISVQTYADTLKELTKKSVPFTLTVIGDGSFRKLLESYGSVLGFKKNIQKYIKKHDVIFASSYLLILESLQMGKQVLSAYSNPLKHDYLHNSPFEKFITISSSHKELAKVIIRGGNKERQLKGQRWANTQTWKKVADMYEELWVKEK